MRIVITASFLAAAIALPGVAQAGVFSCDAKGGKQEGGAVIGAIIGGVIGNKLSDNERGLGTAVGAAAGAAIGSSIGCKMQEEDQRRAEAALEQALATGQPTSWRNPNTGAHGEIRVLPVSAGGSWVAPRTVNVRQSPSTGARVISTLAPGEVFDASVYNSRWLRLGAGAFVARSVVQPAARDGCRTVEQTAYTRKYGSETERYRACQKPGGAWDITRI